jgi:HEPN domain-containing protein
MISKQTKALVNYWATTADHDFSTIGILFKAGKYAESLFFGHLVLEKILKALVVAKTEEQAPKIHDLIRLTEIAKTVLNKSEIKLLNKANSFNLRARYPDYKFSFYKLATKKYTQRYIKEIESLYKKLCHELKQQK